MANHESWQQREKIINRVIALKAMAADGSSPNEASIADKRARKLIVQHEISQSEINIALGIKPNTAPTNTKSDTRTPSATKTSPKSKQKAPAKTRERQKATMPTDLELRAHNERIKRANRWLNIINNLTEFIVKVLSVALIPSLAILFFKIKANGVYGFYENTSTLLLYDVVARRYLLTSIVIISLMALVGISSSKLRKLVYKKVL